MPIIKIKSDFIYFSHIPKCAGTSVENYFSNIPNCSVLFVDREFNTTSELKKWSNSSPQHISGKSISYLFNEDFFWDYFAILRNPLDRFKSSFLFQKYVEKKIEEDIDCNYFINEVLPKNLHKEGWLDNHFQTQINFIIPERKYRLFPMDKEGLVQLKKYIDQILIRDEINIEFPRDNVSSQRIEDNKINLEISQNSISIIEEIYANDLNLFSHLKNKKNELSQFCLTDSGDFFKEIITIIDPNGELSKRDNEIIVLKTRHDEEITKLRLSLEKRQGE